MGRQKSGAAKGPRSPRQPAPATPFNWRDFVAYFALLCVAGFLVYKIVQSRTAPLGSTITAVFSATQVLPRRTTEQDGQPTQFVAELSSSKFKLRRDIGSFGAKPRATLRRSRAWEQRSGGLGAASSDVLGARPKSRVQEGRATATRLAPLPPDFDWQTYLAYNPDVHAFGVASEQQAREHYTFRGRREGRVYKRLRVLLRYTACTGLINQHYSHIAAFTLSAVLGAELVLPPAVKRDSFAHYFSTFKDQNEVIWTPAPLDSLLNVEKIIAFWRSRGLIIHRTPALEPFPDLTQPEKAFPLFPQPEVDDRLVAHLDNVYLQNLDIQELVERARKAVMNHAGRLLRADPDFDIQYIVLDLPCTFFMLKTLSNARMVTDVAQSMDFAPSIQAMADRVVMGITGNGQAEFNAVHLRIEKDARDWSIIMGGEAVVWHNYVMAMRQANFHAGLGLYVASGLLTYGASEEMTHIVKTLKDFGLCDEVHYKEKYLPQREVEALNSEQKALLDFLVLARGRAFVGFGSSTFSFFLREYRVLNGLPRASSVLVDASVIGTDPLFNSAGTVS